MAERNIQILLLIVSVLWAGFLLWEKVRVRRAGKQIRHIVHVNGTRGKSSTARLIEAGLRAGGYRVFCKTTGTDPMTIDVYGEEVLLYRRGKPNIKEQIRILEKAAAQKADVLVVECMAVQPEYQYAAQHAILQADIGVITNVRQDHTDVMGDTAEDIAEALSNTIPREGILFTAETRTVSRKILEKRGKELNCRVVCAWSGEAETPEKALIEGEFSENVSLALAVCSELGVERDRALEGMRHYRRDPYRLSVHSRSGLYFINALSVNDPESIVMILDKLRKKDIFQNRRWIFLINNRADRGSRTQDMLRVCLEHKPSEVWLMGASAFYMKRKLQKSSVPADMKIITDAQGVKKALDEVDVPEKAVVYAIGNIAGEGRAVIQMIREEGEQLAE